MSMIKTKSGWEACNVYVPDVAMLPVFCLANDGILFICR